MHVNIPLRLSRVFKIQPEHAHVGPPGPAPIGRRPRTGSLIATAGTESEPRESPYIRQTGTIQVVQRAKLKGLMHE